jgi:hypothetical protein
MLKTGSTLRSFNIWESQRDTVSAWSRAAAQKETETERATHERKDIASLSSIRQFDREPLRHTSENRRVDVVWSIRRSQHEDPRVVAGRKTIP